VKHFHFIYKAKCLDSFAAVMAYITKHSDPDFVYTVSTTFPESYSDLPSTITEFFVIGFNETLVPLIESRFNRLGVQAPFFILTKNDSQPITRSITKTTWDLLELPLPTYGGVIESVVSGRATDADQLIYDTLCKLNFTVDGFLLLSNYNFDGLHQFARLINFSIN
jgi:hypothetical protein